MQHKIEKQELMLKAPLVGSAPGVEHKHDDKGHKFVMDWQLEDVQIEYFQAMAAASKEVKNKALKRPSDCKLSESIFDGGLIAKALSLLMVIGIVFYFGLRIVFVIPSVIAH